MLQLFTLADPVTAICGDWVTGQHKAAAWHTYAVVH